MSTLDKIFSTENEHQFVRGLYRQYVETHGNTSSQWWPDFIDHLKAIPTKAETFTNWFAYTKTLDFILYRQLLEGSTV